WYGPRPVLLSFPTRRSSDLWFRRIPADAARSRSPDSRLVLASGARAGVGALPFGQASRGSEIPRAAASLGQMAREPRRRVRRDIDRKSTRLNSSHVAISYAV